MGIVWNVIQVYRMQIIQTIIIKGCLSCCYCTCWCHSIWFTAKIKCPVWRNTEIYVLLSKSRLLFGNDGWLHYPKSWVCIINEPHQIPVETIAFDMCYNHTCHWQMLRWSAWLSLSMIIENDYWCLVRLHSFKNKSFFCQENNLVFVNNNGPVVKC